MTMACFFQSSNIMTVQPRENNENIKQKKRIDHFFLYVCGFVLQYEKHEKENSSVNHNNNVVGNRCGRAAGAGGIQY